MRATTLLNNVLDLDGATVTGVTISDEVVNVAVRLRRRRLLCPEPDGVYSTRWTADTRPADSWWRSLDKGARKVIVTAPSGLRRPRSCRCGTAGRRGRHKTGQGRSVPSRG